MSVSAPSTLKITPPDFYYLESDGQVFLIKEGLQWRFPKNLKELPCPFEAVFTMAVMGARVLFAKPILKHHPTHWFHKDELIGREDMSPLVQKAVNRSLPRGAAKVAMIEKGKVLLVRARRGLTQGIWNLPGGFIGYSEHPSESAQREVKEELGIDVTLKRLIGIYTETFAQTGGYMISFVYLGKRRPGVIRPHEEEIESYCWMPIKQAIKITPNPFAKAGLKDYLKGKRTAE